MNSAPVTSRSSPRIVPLALAVLLVMAALWAGLAVPPPAAHALQSTGHGRGHLWASDGVSWLGTYRLSDGRFAFCLEVGRSSPVGNDYDLAEGGAGLGLSAIDRARLAFIARTWSGTTNADTAAAAQLAVWSITGLDGRTLEYYAGRANGSREAVLAKARTFIARAAAEATTGATASVTLALDKAGTGTVTAGLKSALAGGSSTTVPAGTHSGTMTLTGAKFGTGQATSKSVQNGRAQKIRATGFGPTNTVTASVSFPSLPYRSVLTVGTSGAGSQRLLFTTKPSLSAAKTATATALSPRPFSPRVVTETSAATAEAGAELTDKLVVSVRPVVDQLTEWGLYEAAGVRHPIPVTVRSTLYGPFPTPPTKSDDWPAKGPVVCTVATVVAKGAGTYRTKPCTLPEAGYYVWAESIDPKDTPVAKGRARVGPWKSPFGTATEVSLVPFAPSITTAVSSSVVAPGTCVSDRLTATGFPEVEVPVESILLGPFDAPHDEGFDFGEPSDHPVAGSVDTVIAGDGDYESPCVVARDPGHYTFVYRSHGSARGGDGRQEVPAFADSTAHDAESFRVPRPDVPTAPPTPPEPSTPPTTPGPPTSPEPTPSASVTPVPARPETPLDLAFTGSTGLPELLAAGIAIVSLGGLAVAIAAVRRRARLVADLADTHDGAETDEP